MTRLKRQISIGWRSYCEHVVDVTIIRRAVPELSGEFFGLVEHLYEDFSREIAGTQWRSPVTDAALEEFKAWLAEEVE